MLNGKKSYLISFTALFSKKGYELSFGVEHIFNVNNNYHLTAPVNSTYRTLIEDTMKTANKIPHSATGLLGRVTYSENVTEADGVGIETVYASIVSYLSDIYRYFSGTSSDAVAPKTEISRDLHNGRRIELVSDSTVATLEKGEKTTTQTITYLEDIVAGGLYDVNIFVEEGSKVTLSLTQVGAMNAPIEFADTVSHVTLDRNVAVNEVEVRLDKEEGKLIISSLLQKMFDLSLSTIGDSTFFNDVRDASESEIATANKADKETLLTSTSLANPKIQEFDITSSSEPARISLNTLIEGYERADSVLKTDIIEGVKANFIEVIPLSLVNNMESGLRREVVRDVDNETQYQAELKFSLSGVQEDLTANLLSPFMQSISLVRADTYKNARMERTLSNGTPTLVNITEQNLIEVNRDKEVGEVSLSYEATPVSFLSDRVEIQEVTTPQSGKSELGVIQYITKSSSQLDAHLEKTVLSDTRLQAELEKVRLASSILNVTQIRGGLSYADSILRMNQVEVQATGVKASTVKDATHLIYTEAGSYLQAEVENSIQVGTSLQAVVSNLSSFISQDKVYDMELVRTTSSENLNENVTAHNIVFSSIYYKDVNMGQLQEGVTEKEAVNHLLVSADDSKEGHLESLHSMSLLDKEGNLQHTFTGEVVTKDAETVLTGTGVQRDVGTSLVLDTHSVSMQKISEIIGIGSAEMVLIKAEGSRLSSGKVTKDYPIVIEGIGSASHYRIDAYEDERKTIDVGLIHEVYVQEYSSSENVRDSWIERTVQSTFSSPTTVVEHNVQTHFFTPISSIAQSAYAGIFIHGIKNIDGQEKATRHDDMQGFTVQITSSILSDEKQADEVKLSLAGNDRTAYTEGKEITLATNSLEGSGEINYLTAVEDITWVTSMVSGLDFSVKFDGFDNVVETTTFSSVVNNHISYIEVFVGSMRAEFDGVDKPEQYESATLLGDKEGNIQGLTGLSIIEKGDSEVESTTNAYRYMDNESDVFTFSSADNFHTSGAYVEDFTASFEQVESTGEVEELVSIGFSREVTVFVDHYYVGENEKSTYEASGSFTVGQSMLENPIYVERITDTRIANDSRDMYIESYTHSIREKEVGGDILSLVKSNHPYEFDGYVLSYEAGDSSHSNPTDNENGIKATVKLNSFGEQTNFALSTNLKSGNVSIEQGEDAELLGGGDSEVVSTTSSDVAHNGEDAVIQQEISVEGLKHLISNSPEIMKTVRLMEIMYGSKAAEIIEAGVDNILKQGANENFTLSNTAYITDTIIEKLKEVMTGVTSQGRTDEVVTADTPNGGVDSQEQKLSEATFGVEENGEVIDFSTGTFSQLGREAVEEESEWATQFSEEAGTLQKSTPSELYDIHHEVDIQTFSQALAEANRRISVVQGMEQATQFAEEDGSHPQALERANVQDGGDGVFTRLESGRRDKTLDAVTSEFAPAETYAGQDEADLIETTLAGTGYNSDALLEEIEQAENNGGSNITEVNILEEAALGYGKEGTLYESETATSFISEGGFTHKIEGASREETDDAILVEIEGADFGNKGYNVENSKLEGATFNESTDTIIEPNLEGGTFNHTTDGVIVELEGASQEIGRDSVISEGASAYIGSRKEAVVTEQERANLSETTDATVEEVSKATSEGTVESTVDYMAQADSIFMEDANVVGIEEGSRKKKVIPTKVEDSSDSNKTKETYLTEVVGVTDSQRPRKTYETDVSDTEEASRKRVIETEITLSEGATNETVPHSEKRKIWIIMGKIASWNIWNWKKTR